MSLLLSGRHLGFILVLGRTPTWRLHTKRFKVGCNTSANNAWMNNHTSLNLDELLYISIICNIPASWLNLFDGYEQRCLLQGKFKRLIPAPRSSHWLPLHGLPYGLLRGLPYGLPPRTTLINNQIYWNFPVWGNRVNGRLSERYDPNNNFNTRCVDKTRH